MRNIALSKADCAGVLAEVVEQPGLTTDEISARFPHMSKQQVYTRLKWLRDHNVVKSETQRSGGRKISKWSPT